jgi:hypothetical protein
MSMIKKMATAGAVAAMGLGLSAASASAYAISGGAYTGTATANHTFTVGGAYQIECTSATFSGTATGAATTAFTPSYSGCTFFGFPATVTQSGVWSITANSGPVGGVYGGRVDIPAGTTTTIEVPIAGCTVTVTGAQGFAGAGSASNNGSGVDLEASVTGIVYSASGCPFPSGTDGEYLTNGPVTIPGISVS